MSGAPTHGDVPMQQAIAWFVRLDGGQLTAAERAAFEAWRAIPAHAAAFARVERMWADFGAIPAGQGPRLAGLPPNTPLRPWRLGVFALAASIVVMVSCALDLPMRLRSDLRTGVGDTRTHTLPDGSVAVLDSGSAIAVELAPDRRLVRLLRGEAMFDVAPDSARPFVVEAEGGSARALGTRFAVRRHDDGATVTVLESRVRVSCSGIGDDDDAITLWPGQQLDYSAAGPAEVREVDADSETAWTRGKLIFSNRPLGQVVAELNRYFPGHIVVRGNALQERLVSGVFSAADPLAAVDGLEQSLGLKSARITPWLVVLHG